MRYTRRSSSMPESAGASPTAGRDTKTCSNTGRAASASLPRFSSSVGTSRQPRSTRFSLAAICSMPGLLRRALLGVDRQEHHAGGVLADRRKLEVHDRAEEGIRHLREDARAVAGARVRADGAAVLEVAQRRQRQRDDVVAGLAAKRRDHRQTARVLLERGVVHSLLLRKAGQAGSRALTGARSHTDRPHLMLTMGRRRPGTSWTAQSVQKGYLAATVLVAVPSATASAGGSLTST